MNPGPFSLRRMRRLVPAGLLAAIERQREARRDDGELARRHRLSGAGEAVRDAVRTIRCLSADQRADRRFLEHEVIPALGLNDEHLHEQPAELTHAFGRGLHLWQYPNQLAPLLAWLQRNDVRVRNYGEIGARWGGTSIVLIEWLRAINPELREAVLVDPVAMSPLLQHYQELLHADGTANGFSLRYLQGLSTDPDVAAKLADHAIEFAFIDGDHSARIALADHMLMRQQARFILHHDIASEACETRELWPWLAELEKDRFEAFSFTEQYASVSGSFLGFGLLKRR